MYSRAERAKRRGRNQHVQDSYRKTEAKVEADVEIDVVVEKVEEYIPAPPVVALEQTDAQCGYGITPVMAYTPIQSWGDLYEPENALDRGTLFPILDYPFCGKGGKVR